MSPVEECADTRGVVAVGDRKDSIEEKRRRLTCVTMRKAARDKAMYRAPGGASRNPMARMVDIEEKRRLLAEIKAETRARGAKICST